jgi:hypothetical protein
MQLSTASRPTRVRRLLAISAAAVAVMVGPTACDYGVTGGLHGTGSSNVNHDGENANSDPVVVPVANTSQAATPTADRQRRRRGTQTTTTTAPTASADATSTTTSTSATSSPAVAPAAAGTAAKDNPAVGAPLPDGGNAPSLNKGPNNGLVVLGRDCTKSGLPLHDGTQASPACVNTEMGEIAAKDKLPSLLITDAPRVVGMNQAFTLKVATRNLNRNRFLGAKAGGYYLESSFLDDNGLQQGHFHTACRILPTTREAPDSSVDPQFFLATEDGKSDTAPVTIPVPAIGKPGILQCTSWAGDGSHRTPMMTQANETPAIDSVRILVTQRDQPVRYDARGANADSSANIAAQTQPGQNADAKPAAPAAPNAATAPADATPTGGDNAAAPVAEDAAAPAAPSDASTPADTGSASADPDGN